MRKLALLAAAVLTVACLGGGALLLLYRQQVRSNVVGSPTVEFTPTATVAAPTLARRASITWPMFGYETTRLNVAPQSTVRPPFRRVWTAGGRSLLEFPPALGYGRLFVANAAGDVIALSARTGGRAWVYSAKRCVASSPAIGRYQRGTLYETFLNRKPCTAKTNGDGEVVALSVGTGRVRWTKRIGASETSPLLAGNRLYVGDWRGDVIDMDAATGKTLWTFRTSGPVKGALALSDNRLVAGSYDGHLYELNAKSGKLIWRASSERSLFGHGQFYAAPAMAYGRVYVGSTDHKIYSFGATSGKLRWSYTTGGYVYGSPSVWRERIFEGSYDHYFYALDAATGRRLWRFHAAGPISGSSTVINGIVYFATLGGRSYALDARTGKLRWTFADGKYAPAVTDGKRLYVLGFGKAYALAPVG